MLYKRNEHFFHLNESPVCNICNNELIFKQRKKRDTKELYLVIIGCTKCKNLTRKQGVVAFLPKSISDIILEKITISFLSNNYCRKEYWIKLGYNEDEAKIKISEKQKDKQKLKKNFKTKNKQNYLNEGYTEEQIRYIKACPSMLEFWLKKGYSEEDAKIKVSEHQSNTAKKRKYSDCSYPNQIKFWLKKGYSEENAKIEVSKSQTKFSLNICISKYGEELGKIKFNERQIKWARNNKKSNFSKVSQKLFWEIYEKLENKNTFDVYFATFKNGEKIEDGTNNEYVLKLDKSFIKPDFFIKNSKKIIEFDGVYYHNSIPENIKRDIKRDLMIKKNGYLIYHVNENDYKNNKNEVVENCIKFINS